MIPKMYLEHKTNVSTSILLIFADFLGFLH